MTTMVLVDLDLVIILSNTHVSILIRDQLIKQRSCDNDKKKRRGKPFGRGLPIHITKMGEWMDGDGDG